MAFWTRESRDTRARRPELRVRFFCALPKESGVETQSFSFPFSSVSFILSASSNALPHSLAPLLLSHSHSTLADSNNRTTLLPFTPQTSFIFNSPSHLLYIHNEQNLNKILWPGRPLHSTTRSLTTTPTIRYLPWLTIMVASSLHSVYTQRG